MCVVHLYNIYMIMHFDIIARCRVESLYRLVYQLGNRLTRETDKVDYKEALLSLLRLRPDCFVNIQGGDDRAKHILDHAKLPQSRTGRGWASDSANTNIQAESEDNVILKAYR